MTLWLKRGTLVLLLAFCGAFFPQVFASTASDLQRQLSERTITIANLQKEIAKYEVELGRTSAEAKTLKSAIAGLELNKKKLTAQLSLTNQEVASTNLQIEQLKDEIGDKESSIETNHKALAEDMRIMSRSDDEPILAGLLGAERLSVAWNAAAMDEQYQLGLRNRVAELRNLRNDLEVSVSATQKKKAELVILQNKLNSQKRAVVANEAEQTALLKETKNKESNYQKLIADKKAKAAAFEDEIAQIEAQLKLVVDPKSYPAPQANVLAWPVDPPRRLTQYFGNTAFSRTHSAVYNGKGHNGIDLGVSIGTPIKSAAGGVVKGTGNTDLACPNASFGKWVLVEHANGLSSLYAHLSVIEVATGRRVSVGEQLGLSGVTGYATGPHLHFTVYASQGVEIMSRASKSCGGRVYTMPIADLTAYIDPLGYLSNSYIAP